MDRKHSFFAAFGFGPAQEAALASALLRIAREGDATAETSPFGTKYLVEGNVRTPTGRTLHLRTVWIVEPSEPRPRLVTAYPA